MSDVQRNALRDGEEMSNVQRNALRDGGEMSDVQRNALRDGGAMSDAQSIQPLPETREGLALNLIILLD